MKLNDFQDTISPLKAYYKGRDEEFMNMAMALYTALYNIEREQSKFAVGVSE